MKARSLFIAAAVGTLTVGFAAPAWAVDGGATGATITITGGALNIALPTGIVSLGSRANTVAAGTIAGSLGQVYVNDSRGSAAARPG